MMLIVLPQFVYSALKFLVVVVLLVCMVFLLLGINHLSKVDEQPEADSARRLREALSREEQGISRQSVFHKFLARKTSTSRK